MKTTDTTDAPALDTSRSELRRQQVIQAASECFRRHGFHGTSMAQISQAAGMSVGHIYHYFKNKEALIEALVAHDLEQAIDMVDRIRATEADSVLESMLQASPQCINDRFNRNDAALRLEILAEAARNPQIATIVRTADETAQQHFDALFAPSATQSNKDPALAAAHRQLMILAAAGLTLRAIVQPDIDRETLVLAFQELARLVFAPPSAPASADSNTAA